MDNLGGNGYFIPDHDSTGQVVFQDNVHRTVHFIISGFGRGIAVCCIRKDSKLSIVITQGKQQSTQSILVYNLAETIEHGSRFEQRIFIVPINKRSREH